MQCPYCQTENRDDRERCYHCDRDLSMLRLIVNKARHHYNLALEHAERGRYDEAIDELHNALDLDRQFIPAHVVLGTLYTKKGDFERAREAWETALALQPELNKAHRYLGRLQQVVEALPILQKLRVLVTVFGVATLVLLVGLVWTVRREDPAGRSLASAHAAYREGRYATALQRLAATLERADPKSEIAAAAAALRDALQLDLRQKVQMIQDLKYRDEYPQALALIAELEAHEPDPVTSASLAMLKQDINHYYRDRILALYNQFISGEVSYPDLATKVGEYLRLYPNIPEKEELRKFLDDAREFEVTQQMEAIRNRFREQHNVEAAVQAMQKLAATYPGTSAMKKMRAELVDEMLSWMFDQFQGLLDKREFGEAHQLLDRIRNLASEFRDIVDVMGPLELAARVLAENERTEAIRQIDRLVSAGRLDEAQRAIFDLFFDDRLTTAELAVLMAAQERLEKKEIQQRVAALRSRKANYLALNIATDDATQTLALADRALAMRDSLEPTARADLLACAAAAALKIGDLGRAERWIELLAREKATQRTVTQLRKVLATKKASQSKAAIPKPKS